jgi:hypothetical protein
MFFPTTTHTQYPPTERTPDEILLEEKPGNEGGAVFPWTVKGVLGSGVLATIWNSY